MVAAEMTSNQDKDVSQVQYVDISPDFLTTGRTGRRNALPDILGEHKLTSTADLPDRLQALTTNGKTWVIVIYKCFNKILLNLTTLFYTMYFHFTVHITIKIIVFIVEKLIIYEL